MVARFDHRGDEAVAIATASSPGPLSRVVAALEAGASGRADIAATSGLDPEVVDTALDHLVRLGRIVMEPIGPGCPAMGCGSCSSGRADGEAGCGASGPEVSRGPVALRLTRPERD
ncbi:MAG: hypothetical protein R2878_04610 [Thermoleophilia bacterium]